MNHYDLHELVIGHSSQLLNEYQKPFFRRTILTKLTMLFMFFELLSTLTSMRHYNRINLNFIYITTHTHTKYS